MEGLILLLVTASPWAFGAIDSYFESLLYFGLATVFGLWCLRWLVDWRLEWRWDPLPLVLAGLLLVCLVQTVPLPRELLERLSPTAAKIYSELLPSRPEQLPPGGVPVTSPQPPGSTLSLYPSGTRYLMLQLLAVLLTYTVVRNNLTGLASLRRLAWVSVINGVALAFVALLQHFTSPPNVIYWRFASPGTSFGPFVCRNHFPFYLNICLSLGLGLILAARRPAPVYAVVAGSKRRRPVANRADADIALSEPAGLWEWTQTPWVWWVAAGLVLMLASVVLSLSRGGLVALLAGVAVTVLLRLVFTQRWQWLIPVLLVVAAAALLLLWLGFDFIESRYQSLWRGEVFAERWMIWKAAWEAAQDFWLTGAGGGVFAHLEPLYRPEAADPLVAGTYVHNEYLEALVEGGLPRLLLTLLLVFVALHAGWRAVRGLRQRAEQGLALGGMLGLVTFVVHSAGDFGVHLPALALQVTVLTALLTNVADEQAQAEVWSARWWGLAPLVGVTVVGSAAVFLAVAAYRQQVTRFYVAAALQRYPEQKSLAMFEAAEGLRRAVAYSPDFTRYRLEYALAIQRGLELRSAEDQQLAGLTEAADTVLALSGRSGFTFSPPHAWAEFMIANGPASYHRQRVRLSQTEAELRGALLVLLAQIIAVRDQNPLLLHPHLRLAELAPYFTTADSRLTYLGRAKRLRSFDPYVWFQCGMQEWLEEQYETALYSFRRCLELPNGSPYFLPILEQIAAHRSAEEFLTRVVFNQPGYLFIGALRIYPKPEDEPLRRPHLERAVELLRRKEANELTAADWRLKALILQELKQFAEAESCFLKALYRAPREHAWRLELARLYLEQGQFGKARAAVDAVLTMQPNHVAARELAEQLRQLERRVPP
jgi:tetratricopeptide (TPR) repeat protein